MTKLNLSALKKKADTLAHPVSIDTTSIDVTNVTADTAISEVPSFSETALPELTPAASSEVPSAPITSTTSDLPAVKEFFPNLTVNDEIFDEMFTKREQPLASDAVSHVESEVIAESIVEIEETPQAISSTEASIEATTVIDPVENSLISPADGVQTDKMETIDSTGSVDYVQWVAEDLSREREGGLSRLSTSKKTAIFSLAWLAFVGIIGTGLYAFDIFPPVKSSTIETSTPIVSVTPPIKTPPIIPAAQTGASITDTGALSGTGVISGTGSTLTTGTGTSTTTLANTGSITNTGAISGTGTARPTISTSTGGIISTTPPVKLAPVGATGAITPPATNTGIIISSGSGNAIRTPNIRLPRLKGATGAIR
jgi:hypothetical protein